MMAMLKQFQSNPPPAQVKAVEEICVTCGGAHPYYQCLAAGGNTFPEYRDNIQGNYNQGNPGYCPQGVANQMRPPGRPFLRTARALIDVHGEEMILRDGDESTTYSANSLLEEFADELALITYSLDYDDNRTCDIESDI
nr:hypothetical protein [Tanacetum cinerariifolium]